MSRQPGYPPRFPQLTPDAIREGLARDWQTLRQRITPERLRRTAPYLALIPLFVFVWLVAMYIGIAAGFTSPEQVILGAKGIEILDRNGEVIYTFSDEPGSSRVVPLNEISPHVINATIAAEDADFWQNPGVNVKGLLRATYENLAFWENGGLFKGSGGSSLTQQLAKNLYIKPEDRAKRSPVRKIKETILAFELNRRYSKEQILEWYLSHVFYGHGAYGIESASWRYFNKPPSELTLPEAAMLAGIPRAPAFYDPITDFEAAMSRQEQVIGLMVRHDLLSKEQAEAAKLETIGLREGRDPNLKINTEGIAPHFAMYVRDLLPELMGRDNVEGELRILTTLDAGLQRKADTTLVSHLDRQEKAIGATNGALVAMDPRTGEILAMVGSHDFLRDDISGQVNNALSLNQPGSTMKPVTYLAAFQKGWAPSTMINDESIRVQDGETSYVLGNADNRYRGNVPVRVALGSSLNVPAVKTLQFAGLPAVHGLATKMGLTTLHEASWYGPSFTLGGMDANLLDITYVYSVLANGGEQAGISSVLGLPSGARPLDPIAVLQVETVDGKVLWRARAKKERIVPANAVYLITDVLKDDKARVSMFGANSSLNLPGRPAAVKTGSSDNTRDLWAIGYTPQLVVGIWVGNANNKAMPGGTSSLVAAPIWRDFMVAALEGQPVQEFAVPDGVQFVDVCASTGQAPTNGCSGVVKEPFLSGRAPAGSDRQPTQRPEATQQTSSTPGGSPTATPRVTSLTPTPVPSATSTPSVTLLTPTPTRPPITTTPPAGTTPSPTPRLATPTRTPRSGNNGGERND